MQKAQKESLQSNLATETKLNTRIEKLSTELTQVVQQAQEIGLKYKTLRETSKAKENKHCIEMERMIKLVEDTEKALKKEREKARNFEAKT